MSSYLQVLFLCRFLTFVILFQSLLSLLFFLCSLIFPRSSLISLQWSTHFAFLCNLTPPNICFTASKRSFCALNVRQIRAADHQDSTVADKQ